jgi:hypothetical protein
MKTLFNCCIVILMVLISVPAQTQESLVLYDDFNARFINPEKWSGRDGGDSGVATPECFRHILEGRLDMINSVYSNTDSDTGYSFGSNRLFFPNGGDIKAIKATVQVKNYKVSGCTSNTIPTQARARLLGSFFNAGPRTQDSWKNDVVGDFITFLSSSGVMSTQDSWENDVVGEIRIRRLSTSIDPPDVLEVMGYVFQCIDQYCSTATVLGSVDFGTVMIGGSATLRVEWDQTNKRFIFQRDAKPEVYVTYTVSDTELPGAPYGGYKCLELSHVLPNCTTEPRPMAAMRAYFDDVYINEIP